MPTPVLRTAFVLSLALGVQAGWATNFPVTPTQRATAQQVAQAGVPLADLAPDAPDRHTVKPGDTLWGISTLFLKSPWRWPELWGMNQSQIANPHLIYPGQVLLLVKRDGRALLQVAQPVGEPTADARLSPRVRSAQLPANAVASIPQHLIEPFLNEAVVLDGNAFEQAPRIVAAPEGKVMMSQGDTAYVRGFEPAAAEQHRVFRNPRPLLDPLTREVLGYEAAYLGTAQLTRTARPAAEGRAEVPASVQLGKVRQEIGVGDRLVPVPPRALHYYVPHAPEQPVDGRIVSIYGEGLTAGQNQIVALNKGQQDGMQRGHVLTLWRAGRAITDRTAERPETVQLPDEPHGVLLVFQTFTRVSYALIISVKTPVNVGDRFSQPEGH